MYIYKCKLEFLNYSMSYNFMGWMGDEGAEQAKLQAFHVQNQWRVVGSSGVILSEMSWSSDKSLYSTFENIKILTEKTSFIRSLSQPRLAPLLCVVCRQSCRCFAGSHVAPFSGWNTYYLDTPDA